MGPGGRDGRERDVFHRVARAPKRLQSLDGVDFRETAARRLDRKPGEKARHGRAVPLLRGAGARELHPILRRLHERDRIGPDVGLAARAFHRLGQVGRRGGGVECDAQTLPA